MSQITVKKTIEVGGSPTDMDTATLKVTRADTNAVLVPQGTAMTRTGPGVYEYTFTQPMVGIGYNVYYTFTSGATTYEFADFIEGSVTETIPLPPLTGDVLYDTLQSLNWQRLQVIRMGPKVSYNIHGHTVNWNAWLKDLDDRVFSLMRQMAQTYALEQIGIGI